MTVHCRSCQHQWELPIHLPMRLEKFAKAVRAFAEVGCPKCGAAEKDTVICGPAPPMLGR